MNTIQTIFTEKVIPKLKKELGIKNKYAVPKLIKIVINMGVKNALNDKKNMQAAQEVLMQIAGQKPKITKAKKAIASFKLRQGDEIGLAVTLRQKRMYDFFEKLVKVVLPRLRDFRGVSRSHFDGNGNYTLGFAESSVFSEIDPGKIDRVQGMEVCIVTSAKNNKEGMALLEALGMPFVKKA